MNLTFFETRFCSTLAAFGKDSTADFDSFDEALRKPSVSDLALTTSILSLVLRNHPVRRESFCFGSSCELRFCDADLHCSGFIKRDFALALAATGWALRIGRVVFLRSRDVTATALGTCAGSCNLRGIATSFVPVTELFLSTLIPETAEEEHAGASDFKDLLVLETVKPVARCNCVDVTGDALSVTKFKISLGTAGCKRLRN